MRSGKATDTVHTDCVISKILLTVKTKIFIEEEGFYIWPVSLLRIMKESVQIYMRFYTCMLTMRHCILPGEKTGVVAPLLFGMRPA
jgi:hypothetical protein